MAVETLAAPSFVIPGTERPETFLGTSNHGNIPESPDSSLRRVYRRLLPESVRREIWSLRHLDFNEVYARHRRGVVGMSVFGQKLRFCIESDASVTDTLMYCHERPIFESFMQSVGPSARFWDIGAASGLYGLAALAKGAESAVFFEPDTERAPNLGVNLKLNGYSPDGHKAKLMASAVTAVSGPVKFHSSAINAPAIGLTHEGMTPVCVPGVSLDDVVVSGVEPPTNIKIDVEGGELLLFQGGENLFSGPNKPAEVLVEYHPKYWSFYGANPVEVTAFLPGHGYKLVSWMLRGTELLCHYRA